MPKDPIPPYHLGPDAPTVEQSRENDDMKRDAQYLQDGALSSPGYDRSRTPIVGNPPIKPPIPYEWAADDHTDIPTEQQAHNMEEHAERLRARNGGLPDAPPDVPKPKY